MKTLRLLLAPAAAALLFTSCGTSPPAPATGASFDPPSGHQDMSAYSIYFDDGDWLIKDKLGVMVVADQMKGPEPEFGRDLITVYFYNTTQKDTKCRVLRLESPAAHGAGNQTLSPQPVDLPVTPDKKTGAEVGHFKVWHNATTLPVRITVSVEGKQITKNLTLKRRTKAELENNFKPGAAPPYPWLNPWHPQKRS